MNWFLISVVASATEPPNCRFDVLAKSWFTMGRHRGPRDSRELMTGAWRESCACACAYLEVIGEVVILAAARRAAAEEAIGVGGGGGFGLVGGGRLGVA